MDVRIFFKRSKSDFTGVLTIQEYKNGELHKVVFDKVPCRSGSPYWNHSMGDWRRKVSPCPIGDYALTTTPNNRGLKPGAKGIGEAFPISNQKDAYTILGKEKDQKRTEIMFHAENAIPGSAGCIVAINQGQFEQISEYLKVLSKDFKTLPLKVFF